MGDNKETTNPRENDYDQDLMRTEGCIQEDAEWEYEKSQIDGFFHFRDVQHPKIRAEFPDLSMVEIDKKLEDTWNTADCKTRSKLANDAVAELQQRYERTLTEEEKKRYHEMAQEDKEDDNETGRCQKPKYNKDPSAPKRSLSAFFWWSLDERAKVRSLHPEYREGDVAKELGKRWSNADPEIKSKYEAIAAEDEARYDREMTEYNKKLETG